MDGRDFTGGSGNGGVVEVWGIEAALEGQGGLGRGRQATASILGVWANLTVNRRCGRNRATIGGVSVLVSHPTVGPNGAAPADGVGGRHGVRTYGCR